MRNAFALALALGLVALYGFYSVEAKARPKKIDYHSAVCVKTAGGTLVYNANSVGASGSDVWIVCPLQHVTHTDDTTGSVTIIVKARVAGPSSTCQLFSEGLSYVNLPAFPVAPGVIGASGPITVPTNSSTEDPMNLYFQCLPLKKNAELGSIQIQF